MATTSQFPSNSADCSVHVFFTSKGSRTRSFVTSIFGDQDDNISIAMTAGSTSALDIPDFARDRLIEYYEVGARNVKSLLADARGNQYVSFTRAE
tara:strand:+ start:216 stop:500 length:285 start_codon:yes stop_codon:yes gene_type:complete